MRALITLGLIALVLMAACQTTVDADTRDGGDDTAMQEPSEQPSESDFIAEDEVEFGEMI